ncbi:PfkB family carbohydrate kinase [Paratractidigestivibacter sp.]|uniref:PfkB family carbohydrate kinase n=1 Tax=Paratractidigestivibacter sp. TaxID=2847316 RepID=UPI002ABDAA58|nr:PfkB family carbohydrate kinase [Paratractidigestivibacter sp.]
MIDVTALGEVLIDFTDAGTSAGGQKLFERNPGGAPANVLVACRRLGHSAAVIGKVGDDMHGAFLRDVLDENGVDTQGLVTDPDVFTTLAFVALSPDGERSFSFARKPGADTMLRSSEVDRGIIEESRVFHMGSLSLTDEPARSASLVALARASAAGCIKSYDPNYRASLWGSKAEAAAQMRSVVEHMDVVKISAEECELLTDKADPAEAAAAILSQGPSIVVVTLDAEGAYVATQDGDRTVPSFRTEAVDTTGAGDSFWGGFLCALVESGKAPAEVGIDEAAEFVRFGNAVASLCVRARGGIPAMPSREAVDKLLAGA